MDDYQKRLNTMKEILKANLEKKKQEHQLKLTTKNRRKKQWQIVH